MFGLIFRLAIVFSIPIASIFRKANAGELLDTAVNEYSVEAIIVLCVLMMIVGCFASILTPEPEGIAPTKVFSKVVFSIFGSLCAFIYIVHIEKGLNLVHAAWVGGVSYAAPAIIPSLKALVYELIPVAKQHIKDFLSRFFGGSGRGSNE
ncbi:hypothetical protein [Acinetobacter sp. CFCC 10889]|uniref:hypothetical protein n=1 Tax=Acinetobacter sp. CFCC 10889 TaxID=1775557 RepID=UPI000DCFA7DE|nr:hypothetical protein [Acinetobacter sp. CFCC 10889]